MRIRFPGHVILQVALLLSVLFLSRDWCGAFLVSLGNVELLHWLSFTKRCRQSQCIGQTPLLSGEAVKRLSERFELAGRLSPANGRIRIGQGLTFLAAGDCSEALTELNAASDFEQHPVLAAVRTEAARCSGSAEQFVDLYQHGFQRIPRRFTERWRPLAASLAVELARNSPSTQERNWWLKRALEIWPDNLCASSFAAIFGGELSSTHLDRISGRRYDGAYSSDPEYQKCLLELLPVLALTDCRLLPQLVKLLDGWIWQEGAPSMVDVFRAFLDQDQQESLVYKALANAYLADGNWDLARAAFQEAAARVPAPLSGPYTDSVGFAESLAKLSTKGVLRVAARPGPLDILWMEARVAEDELDSPAAKVLVEELRRRFVSTRQIKLTRDWLLQDIFVDEGQLEMSSNITLWLLVEPTAESRVFEVKESLPIGRGFGVRLVARNLVDDAGFEVGTGRGRYLPRGFERVNRGGRYEVVGNRRGEGTTQAVQLTGRNGSNASLGFDVPVEPGRSYLFQTQTRALQEPRAPALGGSVICDWRDRLGWDISYEPLYSWYAPTQWWNSVSRLDAPERARKCVLTPASNDEGAHLLFDNFLVVDITDFLDSLSAYAQPPIRLEERGS